MKKVGKYVLITLLILVGLFFVGLLFLFFVPKSSLFGITFISYNEKTFSKFYGIDEFDSVVVNSRAYNIEVKNSNIDEFYIKFENHSLGYVLKDNKDLIVKENLNNKKLTFTVIEPYGVAFKNNSSITLYLPKDKTINLELNNKKADVKIDNADLTFNNFALSTEKGNLNLKKATILGQVDLNMKKGDVKISENVVLNKNNINLKITTGKFDASNSVLGNLNIQSNERGVILLNECNTLTQHNQTSGGRIEANKVYSVAFYGTDTNLYLKEITNGAIISLTTGEIKIDSLSGTSDIDTKDGNVNINTLYSNLTVSTSVGSVNIPNAYKQVFATTETGNIDIHFNTDADYASSSSLNNRYLKVITDSGNVTATGLNSANIYSKKGTVNVNFASFSSDLGLISNIETKSGSIFVTVNYADKYILNSQTNGNSRINLMQTEVYNGWTDKKIENKSINGADQNGANVNKITIISNSGSILMHDNKVS